MKCFYKKCRKPILSKKDLVVGFWWAMEGFLQTYHKKCFNEIMSSTILSIAPPATLNPLTPNKLGLQKILNGGIVLIIAIIFIFLIINSFNISVLGLVGILFFSILFSAIPIMNLITINKIEKLLK